jgi:putative Ca2+/H+ antiporter (TMEM165/GDT1 family)
MDLKTFATIFATVFMAELGDKTQLATVIFAAQAKTPLWGIFAAASLALVCAAALGVLAGSVLHQYVNVKVLTLIAGVGFIGIGLWTLVGAVRD